MGNLPFLASSFDEVSEAYDRFRPHWPEHSLDAIGLPAKARVVEVGAGTGRLTQLLAKRFRDVVAIEPLGSMPTFLVQTGVHVVRGVAEGLPLRTASFDAVVAAEAFHWFDQRQAAAEFVRVLKPNGLLILMWNRRAAKIAPEPSSSAWREIERLFASTGHPLLEYKSSPWIALFQDLPVGGFQSASIDHTQILLGRDFPYYASTLSWVAAQPADKRESLLRRLGEELTAPVYHLHWRTDVHWALRES